jgi:hypothetical protein
MIAPMVATLRRVRIVPLSILLTAVIVGAWPWSALAATDPLMGGSNTAGNFAVLAGTTVTNTGPTWITGQLGVSPGSAVTGFPPGTSGVQHKADPTAATAQTDLTAAYLNAQGQACPPANDRSNVNLGGQTLVPGVYCQSTAPTLTGTLILNGSGVYIFQIGTAASPTTLVTAPNAVISLTGGAQPCQVFWVVTSSATIATSTSFVGTIMALQQIAMQTRATLQGRALARNAQVTLDTNTITQPTGCGFAAPTPVPSPAPTPTPTPVPTATPVALPNAGGPPQQPGFPWWPLVIAGTGILGAGLFIGLRKRTPHRDR